MVMFKGIEFRLQQRRISRCSGLKVKPEALVASYSDGDIWVRDVEPAGLMYSTDEGKRIKLQLITSWLPPLGTKTKEKRDKFIKTCLSAFAAEHRKEIDTYDDATSDDSESDALTTYTTAESTISDDSESDTPSKYTTVKTDNELLALYHDDDHVPDEVAAFWIGRAKARSAGLSPVPSSVVIETKRSALRIDIEPWIAEPYLQYLESVAASTSTANSKKRKRSLRVYGSFQRPSPTVSGPSSQKRESE